MERKRLPVLGLRITAHHLMENLSVGLYKDPGDCLFELVRNGVTACMNGKWDPKRGNLDIRLVEKHPLSPKSKALVILDHGRGFTDGDIAAYCTIGRAIGDNPDGSLHGAAQKRIGRFAAFSLNSGCVDGDVNTGFYILTRTSQSGNVRYIPMILSQIEMKQGLEPCLVDDTCAEMGPLKGIKGSFSAIVIPNSVFRSGDEIRDSIKWKLPRKQSLMFRLSIDGKLMSPPSLAPTECGANGDFDAFIGRTPDSDQDGGIWIADANTGFRVAYAPQLGPTVWDYPLWERKLTGDIFVPGALAAQDTGRSRLVAKFFRSRVWQRLQAYLVKDVVPKARALLGDEDSFTGKGPSKDLMKFIALCNEVYGNPDPVRGDDDTVGQEGNRNPRPSGETPENPDHPVTDNPPSETKPKRRRTTPLRIGDRTFMVSKRPLDPMVLAQVDPTNGTVIHFNEDGYAALPGREEARGEHVALMVLHAIGQYDYPGDPHAVQRFVSIHRKELLDGKKSQHS